MPVPDLWENTCQRLEESAAAVGRVRDGASLAAAPAVAADSAAPAALPRRIGRRGAPDGSAWPQWAAMLAAAAAVLAVAAGLAIAGRPQAGPERGNGAEVLFPGGGRLLFADEHGLKWLYPDGKTAGLDALARRLGGFCQCVWPYARLRPAAAGLRRPDAGAGRGWAGTCQARGM